MIRRVCLVLLSAWAVLPAGAETAPVATQEQLNSYLKASEAALKPWRETTMNVLEAGIGIPELFEKFRDAYGLRIRASAGAATPPMKLSLDFSDSKAIDVLEFVAEVGVFEIVIDRDGALCLAAEKDLESLGAPGWREARTLRRLARIIEQDRILITEPASHAEILKQIDLTDSTLIVKDVTLPKALEELSRQTGLAIHLGSTCLKDPRLTEVPSTHEFRDRPLKEILDALCAAHGLEWYIMWEAVVLAPPEIAKEDRGRWARLESERTARLDAEATLLAREIRISGKDLTVAQIAALLEKALGVPCRTDPETWVLDRRWTLTDRSYAVSEILQALTADDRLRAGYRGGVLWIVAGEAE